MSDAVICTVPHDAGPLYCPPVHHARDSVLIMIANLCDILLSVQSNDLSPVFHQSKPSVLAKSIPRCHFPTMQVRYPWDCSMLATVVRPSSRIGAEYPPITSDLRTERQLYLPVRKPYREGVHTAAVAWASVKRIPLSHIRSRFGVVKGHFH